MEVNDLCFDLLMFSKAKSGREKNRKTNRHSMLSSFGQTSQRDIPVRVHDVAAEENPLPSFLKYLSILEYRSHDASQVYT